MRSVAFAILSTFAAIPAFAHAEPEFSFDRIMVRASLQTIVMEDAIDWKVGDTANYRFTLRTSKGTMVQSVTQDDGNSIWMRQVFKVGTAQPQTLDIELSKADGSVEKVLQNGEEVDVGDDGEDDLEIISADEASVTVPAGKFDCLHIVAKQSDGYKLESWNNDTATVMDGTIKQIIGTDMGNMKFELTSFKHGS